MMSTRWARFTRGWLIAVFSVFVAALSHSFAGGVTPGWLAIVLSLAFASMLSIALSGPRRAAPGRPPAPWRVVFSVAGSQIIFHGLFSLFGEQLAAARPAGLGAHAGHHLSSAAIAAQLAVGTPLPGTPNSAAPLSGTHHDAWMLLGHTIAGLLSVAMILRGEQTARGLLRTAGLALRALSPRPIVVTMIPDAAPARPAASTVWIPRPLDVVHAALRHRGPPALLRA